MLVAVSVLGIVGHILMDLATSYGTRLFSPFDWHWYAVDWMPIVDIYLLAILIAGLTLARAGTAKAARLAMVALTLTAADYGLRAVAHQQVLAVSRRVLGASLPAPCGRAPMPSTLLDRWPTTPFELPPPGEAQCLVELAATPTFLSPFSWTVITRTSNAYALNDVDLLRGTWGAPEAPVPSDRLSRVTRRYPDQWRPQTLQAATLRDARIYLGFARFPITRTFVEPDGHATVRWSDARFAANPLASRDVRRPDMLSLSVRVAPDGTVSRIP